MSLRNKRLRVLTWNFCSEEAAKNLIDILRREFPAVHILINGFASRTNFSKRGLGNNSKFFIAAFSSANSLFGIKLTELLLPLLSRGGTRNSPSRFGNRPICKKEER